MRKILFITATHGNEQDGTVVMQRLEKELPKAEYGYDWIIANEKAYDLNVRFVEQDLNRSAPGDISSSIYEVRRAAEIIELSKQYDAVVDLHGTKTDSGIVTIIPLPTKQNIELATSTGLQRNVIWYAKESETAGPLVQHASIPAIEFECGPRGTDTAVELTYAAVRRFIEQNYKGEDADSHEATEFYDVYGKLLGDHDPELEDFVLTSKNGESFYPFLSGNEYSGIVCYKMNKVDAADIKYV